MRLHRLLMMRVASLVLMALAWGLPCAAVRAQLPPGPRLTLEPRHPEGGVLTRLTIDRLAGHGDHGDSVLAVDGTMAGEPLHFIAAANGAMEALGAIPVEVSDSVVALVHIARQSGACDTLRVMLRYPHNPAPATPTQARGRTRGASRLHVDKRFTQRMDSATEARIEQENELARSIGRHAQDTPQLWTLSFLRPRQARVTSRFGRSRVFNGRVSSSHLGVDYRGALGDPIYAANRGVVALVASFFLAGNVVYIDHGDGILTGYFHMSQPEVAVGDTVERGQEIGKVGATGRVTGPHLHWSARFGALTIDPADLLSLGAPFVTAGASTIGR
ncbi:MAG: M23 family metallopeptidase [Gemmatimonadales bacterium]